MKTVISFALAFCLFGSIALADGDMGNGGYQGCTPQNCPPPPCTENCTGGRQAISTEIKIGSMDVIYIMVKQAMQIRF